MNQIDTEDNCRPYSHRILNSSSFGKDGSHGSAWALWLVCQFKCIQFLSFLSLPLHHLSLHIHIVIHIHTIHTTHFQKWESMYEGNVNQNRSHLKPILVENSTTNCLFSLLNWVCLAILWICTFVVALIGLLALYLPFHICSIIMSLSFRIDGQYKK